MIKNLFLHLRPSAFKRVINPKIKKKNLFYQNFQHCLNETMYENIYQLPAAHYLEYDIKKKNSKFLNIGNLKKRKDQCKNC